MKPGGLERRVTLNYLVHRFLETDQLYPIPDGTPHVVVRWEHKHDGGYDGSTSAGDRDLDRSD
jgi:hypothetical protein